MDRNRRGRSPTPLLGMDWLNKYRVVIDCFNAIISFKMNGVEVKYRLVMPRPLSMPIKELWDKPILAAIIIDEVTIAMVPVVKQFRDVFPNDLPSLP